MSILFVRNNKNLWWPASQVARIFVAQSKLVGDWAGCDFELEVFADEVEVDFTRLRDGLEKVISQYESSNHDSLKMMIRGAIVHLMVLYIRCDGNLSELAVTDDDLISPAVELARVLPH